MIQEEQPTGVIHWFRESIVAKLIFIGALVLLLLIPQVWVSNLITERTSRQEEMITDVSNKWSGAQLVQGPVLIIPYKKQITEKDNNQKEVIKEVIENLYILPENLNIKAKVNSFTLHRGIFDVGVYNTSVSVTGNFHES
jgi:inner membrane protein